MCNLHIKNKVNKVSDSTHIFIYPVLAVFKYKNTHTCIHTDTHKCSCSGMNFLLTYSITFKTHVTFESWKTIFTLKNRSNKTCWMICLNESKIWLRNIWTLIISGKLFWEMCIVLWNFLLPILTFIVHILSFSIIIGSKLLWEILLKCVH